MEAQNVKQWAQPAMQQARAGNIKWSDYYLELYERIKAIKSPVDGKGFYLQASATMIDVSKAYESGRISKDEFDSTQRQMEAKGAEYDEQLRHQKSAEISNAYSQFLYNQSIQAQAWAARKPQFSTCSQYGNTANCAAY